MIGLKFQIGILAMAVGTIGLMYWQIERLTGQKAELQLKLQSCAQQITNIREDIASDATVDDPSNFDIPDHWLSGNNPAD